jgi:hypothetical protein
MFVGVVLPFMVSIFEDFLAAADAAVGLIGAGDTAGRWEEPSALEGFTVGGLTAHLGWQVQSAWWALSVGRPEPGAPVTPLLEHYAKAAWIGAAVDAPVNVGIRDAGQERAKAGASEQERLTREARERIAEVFGSGSVQASTVVAVPWIEGRAMAFGDLLTTRLMELLVHGDDLAVSLGVATPVFPESAMDTVLDLLVRVSRVRHGSLPVLRALARRERAPESIAAF